MNATQAAKHLGVSRVTFAKLVRKGIITASDSAGSQYAPAVLAKQWAEYVSYRRAQTHQRDGSKRRRRNDGKHDAGRPTKKDAKRLKKAAASRAIVAAQKAYLELQQMRQGLVSAEEVKKDARRIGETMIRHLKTIPGKVAEELSKTSDAVKVHDILDDALNQMVRDIRKEEGVDDD